jgi:hypothetical protein
MTKSIGCDWRILFEFCMAAARGQTAVPAHRSPVACREPGGKRGETATRAQGPAVKAREQPTEAERGQAQQTAFEQAARDEADRKAAASTQRVALSSRVR